MLPHKSISRRQPLKSFIESAASVPCTMWVRKKLIANLQQAARSRVGRVRAERARQLLEQIAAEDSRGQHSQFMGRPRAPRASGTTLPAAKASPKQGTQLSRSRSLLRRGVKAIVHWANRAHAQIKTGLHRRAF